MNTLEPLIVGVISQKGGVGKSFVSRIIAREFATADWDVKIADLDISQGTTTNWKRRRDMSGISPEISVEPFRTLEQALRKSEQYNLVILDAPPYSSALTLDIARRCHRVIIPTGLSLDDLEPAVLLAHEITSNGINPKNLTFLLSKVGDSQAEITDARNYITKARYRTLSGELPEKTLYRRATDVGKAATEVKHPSLRKKAEEVAQSLIDFIT